jgi:hypothetical protein
MAFADTPVIEFNEVAKLLKVLLFPADTVNEEELLAEFIPNVDAV